MQIRHISISELARESEVGERWAVAVEGTMGDTGVYTWIRDEDHEIAVFSSKTDAQLWVLSGRDFLHGSREVVFVKLP